MPRLPSTKKTRGPLNWQRIPDTITELNTLTFVIILFAKEFSSDLFSYWGHDSPDDCRYRDTPFLKGVHDIM